MKIEIIENIEDFPQFEARNVFQIMEWMRLFEGEDDTKVVLFAVYANAQCTMHNAQLDAIGDMDKSQLLLLQPVVIQRFVKWLPCRLGSYAVAWREPWRAEYISNEDAQQLFEVLQKAINQYCRRKALYIEYRHFAQDNIYHSLLLRHCKVLPWYNIYNQISASEDVEQGLNKSKRKQLRQSFKAGVRVELNPNDDEIREWYVLLKKLYKRIHRPLPSVNVFLRLNKSGIGRVFVVIYKGRVISGSAILCLLSKEKNSQFYRQRLKDLRFSTLNSQLFYDWYRASTNEQIEGIYPSVVSTWQAMQWIADMGGGRFDFMGAGRQNKEYGVRQFKLKFGGKLIPEYRYRKCLMK